MAKARAIVKRRKAVRNIRKITKTMQMIATAKYQKALKRAVGSKPYTLKIRELAAELATHVGDVDHPLLRRPSGPERVNRVAVLVITSGRGLCGGYNANVLRTAAQFIRDEETLGNQVDLYVSGKKGVTYFNFRKRAIAGRFEELSDIPTYARVERGAENFMKMFTERQVDAGYIVYMNFLSAGAQRPNVLQVLPLSSIADASQVLAQQAAEREAQLKAGMLDLARGEQQLAVEEVPVGDGVTYDFSPDPATLVNELLPLTVKTMFYQAFLDAVTSEHIARMVAMKSATDNADKMVKALTMKYNRARQSQITTELSEIMGGVEAMKS